MVFETIKARRSKELTCAADNRVAVLSRRRNSVKSPRNDRSEISSRAGRSGNGEIHGIIFNNGRMRRTITANGACSWRNELPDPLLRGLSCFGQVFNLFPSGSHRRTNYYPRPGISRAFDTDLLRSFLLLIRVLSFAYIVQAFSRA